MTLFKKDNFPRACKRIVAEDILTAIISEQFKIAVVRGQPLIQNLAHVNDARLETKSSWSLLAPIAAVTFHIDSFHKPPTLSGP
jgi:hypothetical protein